MSALRQPDLATIGGRLKAERERLALSQPAMAALAGVAKGTQIQWEAGRSSPTAVQLAAFAEVGADVLYIVTGRFALAETSPEGPLVGVNISRILSHLPTVDRRNVLLFALADELRA